MMFSKSFAKKTAVGGTEWEEVKLTDDEEKQVDERARTENIVLMNQCIEDAKSILIKKGLMSDDLSIVDVAIALFEKRASHSIYLKERKAKEKFDKK